MSDIEKIMGDGYCTQEAAVIICQLGAAGIAVLERVLSEAQPDHAPDAAQLIDDTARKHLKHEHLQHRQELLGGLGYTSLGAACPDIARAYLGLIDRSERLRGKVARGEVGFVGLLRGYQHESA